MFSSLPSTFMTFINGLFQRKIEQSERKKMSSKTAKSESIKSSPIEKTKMKRARVLMDKRMATSPKNGSTAIRNKKQMTKEKKIESVCQQIKRLVSSLELPEPKQKRVKLEFQQIETLATENQPPPLLSQDEFCSD